MSKYYQQCKGSIERYLEKLDRIVCRVPKGRKADVEAYAAKIGKSVNALIADYLQQCTGMTAEEWRQAPPAEEPEAPEEKEP